MPAVVVSVKTTVCCAVGFLQESRCPTVIYIGGEFISYWHFIKVAHVPLAYSGVYQARIPILDD